MMTKSMSIYMPFLMGYMSYSLASGLALYFLASNIFGIVQYSLLGRSNWANILPFLKKKEEKESTPDKQKPVIVEAEAVDVPEDNDDDTSVSSSDKMRMPKRKRPKRKKNS
jgi:YidC/Oxa1 family membrane protein insertase